MTVDFVHIDIVYEPSPVNITSPHVLQQMKKATKVPKLQERCFKGRVAAERRLGCFVIEFPDDNEITF